MADSGPGDTVTTDSRDMAVDNDYNYRIPNEIIKKRAVVVIGKNNGQYIVIPISSKKAMHKKAFKEPANTGLHVLLKEEDLPKAGKYSQVKNRWAKCDLITTVDGGRLRDIYDAESERHAQAHPITSDTLLKIRYGVMMAIGLREIIP